LIKNETWSFQRQGAEAQSRQGILFRAGFGHRLKPCGRLSVTLSNLAPLRLRAFALKQSRWRQNQQDLPVWNLVKEGKK
jgi:hypothetical protein